MRNLFAHSLELLQTRIELLATELEEETVRLIGLLAYGAAAFFLLGTGILFLAIFLTVLFWEDHRLLTLAILTLIFLAGGSVASFFALQTARARRRPLAASLAELAEDSVNLQARE